MIEHTIEKGWQGLREPDAERPIGTNGNGSSPPQARQAWQIEADIKTARDDEQRIRNDRHSKDNFNNFLPEARENLAIIAGAIARLEDEKTALRKPIAK